MPTDPDIRRLVDRFTEDAVGLAGALRPFLLVFAQEVAAIQRDTDAKLADILLAPTVARAIRGDAP